jgi:hypothetical protein
MHRRIVLFVALAAAFALAAPAGASAESPADLAPSVAEAQQATTACGPGGVGDQLVPDSGPWFNFTAACANHDACYAAQRGQLNCDNWFRDDMYAAAPRGRGTSAGCVAARPTSITTRCGASDICSTAEPQR